MIRIANVLTKVNWWKKINKAVNNYKIKTAGLFERVTIAMQPSWRSFFFVFEIVDISKEFIQYVEKQVYCFLWREVAVLSIQVTIGLMESECLGLVDIHTTINTHKIRNILHVSQKAKGKSGAILDWNTFTTFILKQCF
jgi:hypothetical protein